MNESRINAILDGLDDSEYEASDEENEETLILNNGCDERNTPNHRRMISVEEILNSDDLDSDPDYVPSSESESKSEEESDDSIPSTSTNVS